MEKNLVETKRGCMTKSLEDYLEKIYGLRLHLAEIRVKDIAQEMGVSQPSVNQAIKELGRLELIKHLPYSKIEFTQKGLELAKQIADKHYILKSFLMKGLGVSEETAEKDACLIEHIISQESLERMGDFYRKQEQAVCSQQVPELEFHCEQTKTAKPLSGMTPGEKGIVLCVNGGDCLKKRLQEYGFLVNETIEMIRNVPQCPFLILVKGYQVAIGRGIGEKILIKSVESNAS